MKHEINTIESQSLLRQRTLSDSHPAKLLHSLYIEPAFPQPTFFTPFAPPTTGPNRAAAVMQVFFSSRACPLSARSPPGRPGFQVTPTPPVSVHCRPNAIQPPAQTTIQPFGSRSESSCPSSDHHVARAFIAVSPSQNLNLLPAGLANPVDAARVGRGIDRLL